MLRKITLSRAQNVLAYPRPSVHHKYVHVELSFCRYLTTVHEVVKQKDAQCTVLLATRRSSLKVTFTSILQAPLLIACIEP
jgi:hypothetical protein